MRVFSHVQNAAALVLVVFSMSLASCFWVMSRPSFGDGDAGQEPDADGLDGADGADGAEQDEADFPVELDQTDGDDAPPTVPQGLTATAESSTAVSLSWEASTDDTGVLGYTVLRDGASVDVVSATAYRDEPLLPGTTYTYRVNAFDGAGNISDLSDPAEVTTPAVDVQYVALKAATGAPPVIDGDLSEYASANVIILEPPEGGNRAEVRVLWDAAGLYISYDISDTQLNAQGVGHDDGRAWDDDAVEFFFDVMNDDGGSDDLSQEYMLSDDFHLIFNIQGAVIDARGTASGSQSGTWNGTWNPVWICDGTINDNSDDDGGCRFEIAIPWDQLDLVEPPADDTVMGMTFTVEDEDEGLFSYIMWGDIIDGPYANASIWRDVLLSSEIAP
jgi:hypothetical protein